MKTPLRGYVHQLTAAVVLSISIIILGNTLGWPSPVLLDMKKTGKPMNLTTGEISWMVASLYLGNLFSPFGAGYLMDQVGRKYSFLMLSIIPLISWILILFSNTAFELCVARFMGGLWGGTVTTIAPMYLAEIAEPKLRGSLSTFVQINIYLGLLFEYLVGPFVSYEMLAALSGVMPLLFILFFWNMPESPYWQVMNDNDYGASLSLAWLRGELVPNLGGRVSKEIEELSLGVHEEMHNTRVLNELCSTKGHRKAMIIVQVLAAAQRFSGISAMMAFMSTTLPQQGAGMLSPSSCSLVVAVVWLASVFVSTFLIDSWGRRPLLILSTAGSALGTFGAGLWFFLDEKTSIPVQEFYWVPFACFVFYGFAFSVGLGPIPTTVQGEMFSAKVKGFASAITAVSLALSSFIVNITYKHIEKQIGNWLNYWLFTGASVITLFFVIFFVIETKGKTLHEIHQELEK